MFEDEPIETNQDEQPGVELSLAKAWQDMIDETYWFYDTHYFSDELPSKRKRRAKRIVSKIGSSPAELMELRMEKIRELATESGQDPEVLDFRHPDGRENPPSLQP